MHGVALLFLSRWSKKQRREPLTASTLWSCRRLVALYLHLPIGLIVSSPALVLYTSFLHLPPFLSPPPLFSFSPLYFTLSFSLSFVCPFVSSFGHRSLSLSLSLSLSPHTYRRKGKRLNTLRGQIFSRIRTGAAATRRGSLTTMITTP